MRGAACWGGTEGRYDLEGRTEVSTTILMTYPSSVKQGGGISGVILAQQAWCPAGGARCAMAVFRDQQQVRRCGFQDQRTAEMRLLRLAAREYAIL